MAREAGSASGSPSPERGGELDELLLIVDDEPEVRLMLRMALQPRGWTIEEAPCGQDAIDRCRRPPTPAVVLLDQRMPPGPSGLEVARTLRAEGFGAPIALYSAYFSPEVEKEAGEVGIGLIPKGRLRHLDQVLRGFSSDPPG